MLFFRGLYRSSMSRGSRDINERLRGAETHGILSQTPGSLSYRQGFSFGIETVRIITITPRHLMEGERKKTCGERGAPMLCQG